MKIKVVTGQQGTNILEVSKSFDGDLIEFPETEICHSYDLCEHVMQTVQEHVDRDINLIIVTYSEIVLDAVRLWVARNKFENAECVNILSDGNYINIPINKNGEMEKWIEGVFDIKNIILRELFEIRKERM